MGFNVARFGGDVRSVFFVVGVLFCGWGYFVVAVILWVMYSVHTRKGEKNTWWKKRCRERKKEVQGKEKKGVGRIMAMVRLKGGKEVQRGKKYGLCLKKNKDHRSDSKETRRKATKGDHDGHM
jgi:hypothetical protein